MKKLVSFALCACLLCLMASPVNASTRTTRLLEYTHIDTVTANITLDSFWGIVSCDGAIVSCGDYPVYVEVYLQQKTDNGWETLQTWTSSGQIMAEASGRYAVARGYQYRAYTAGYVYDNGTIIDSGYAIYSITYE